MATLVSLAGRVPTTEPFSSDAGRSLVSWYVDPKLSSVIIGVTAITPKLTADVQSGFGKLAQLVIAAPAHLHACCYRLHDSPSWYGSDRITASDLAQCTSGFEVYKQISPGVYDYGLLTAGHCWSVGTTVQQGYLDCYNIQHTFGSVGKVTVRSYGDYVTDTEFLDSTTIGTSASPYLWYGSQSNPQGCPETSSPGAIKITGSGPNYVGRNVCFDGSVTGENCNGVVAATNVCEQFVYYECGLDKATGNGLATNGDSGGPIESANGMGTGVVVYGTDVGGDPGVEWYADITSELNALNVGLITG